jgi:hypothetical protein
MRIAVLATIVEHRKVQRAIGEIVVSEIEETPTVTIGARRNHERLMHNREGVLKSAIRSVRRSTRSQDRKRSQDPKRR